MNPWTWKSANGLSLTAHEKNIREGVLAAHQNSFQRSPALRLDNIFSPILTIRLLLLDYKPTVCCTVSPTLGLIGD